MRPTVTVLRHVRLPFVHGLFVSWGATGWRFVINSRVNIHVTIDCSTVSPLVLGVVTRQKPQINGSVVLGADESPWPCGTPSWYTPLSWMILSKQKNLHLFSSQYICVFSKTSVCPSVRLERFPGICWRSHGGNGLKFCMLMYLGHLQNWSDYGHGLLVFLLLASLWLSEMGQIWGFQAFPGVCMVGITWNFACWCILITSELISLWSRSVDFSYFGIFVT